MTASSRVGWVILASVLGMLALGRPASASGFEAHGNVSRGGGIVIDSYSNVFTGHAQFDNTAVLQTDQSIHLEADSSSSGPGQHAHSFAGWTHEIGTPTDPVGFGTFLAQSGTHATFTDFVITPPRVRQAPSSLPSTSTWTEASTPDPFSRPAGPPPRNRMSSSSCLDLNP